MALKTKLLFLLSIVTSRESLVWKIYAKRAEENKKKESSNQRVCSPQNAQKSNVSANPIELGKLEKLECPFKDEFNCNLTEKQSSFTRIVHHAYRPFRFYMPIHFTGCFLVNEKGFTHTVYMKQKSAPLWKIMKGFYMDVFGINNNGFSALLVDSQKRRHFYVLIFLLKVLLCPKKWLAGL